MRLGTNPTPRQLAELDRWLHDLTDVRTVDQLKADLRALRVWPTGLRWMGRWFQ